MLPVTVPVASPVSRVAATQPAIPFDSAGVLAVDRTSLIDNIGVVAVALYLFAGLTTDLTLRLLGSKSYLSIVAGLLMLVTFLMSGKALRGLQYRLGQLWLFLLIWMVLSIFTSRWRSGSFELMQNYIPKIHLLLFYAVAFSVTLPQCRKLFYTHIAAGFTILVSCFAFGSLSAMDARFSIPGSMMFDNPNDLALGLVVMIGFFTYFVSQPGIVKRVLGLIGIGISFYFMMKTGSRGSLLACVTCFAAFLIMSKHRVRILLIAVVLAVTTVLIIPGETLSRLSLLFTSAQDVTPGDKMEESAMASQVQRKDLLFASLRYTFVTRPFSGVGPGQFSDAYWEDSKRQGKHVASLGTHNTYTQVGSECGLLAFLAYVAVVVISIRTNYRVYRSVADRTEDDARELATMSFALLMTAVAFSVNICFHHVAYSGYLPMIAALTISVQALAKALPPAEERKPQPAFVFQVKPVAR